MSVAVQFNAQGIDPKFGGPIDPVIENGWHHVIIADTESKEIADRTKGSQLLLKLRTAPDDKNPNTEVTHRINLYHNDPAVRDRALQEMAAICFAVGVGGYNNTAELHNRPFWIENQQREETYTPPGGQPTKQMRNRFIGVRNEAGVEPGKATTGSTAMPPGQPQPPGAPAAPPGQPPAGQWAAPPTQPAPTNGGWAPSNGAPAAPSQPAPGAPAGGWGGAPPNPPPQQQQPAFQPAPQPPSNGWQPNGGGAAPAAPAWGQR